MGETDSLGTQTFMETGRTLRTFGGREDMRDLLGPGDPGSLRTLRILGSFWDFKDLEDAEGPEETVQIRRKNFALPKSAANHAKNTTCIKSANSAPRKLTSSS